MAGSRREGRRRSRHAIGGLVVLALVAWMATPLGASLDPPGPPERDNFLTVNAGTVIRAGTAAVEGPDWGNEEWYFVGQALVPAHGHVTGFTFSGESNVDSTLTLPFGPGSAVHVHTECTPVNGFTVVGQLYEVDNIYIVKVLVALAVGAFGAYLSAQATPAVGVPVAVALNLYLQSLIPSTLREDWGKGSRNLPPGGTATLKLRGGADARAAKAAGADLPLRSTVQRTFSSPDPCVTPPSARAVVPSYGSFVTPLEEAYALATDPEFTTERGDVRLDDVTRAADGSASVIVSMAETVALTAVAETASYAGNGEAVELLAAAQLEHRAGNLTAAIEQYRSAADAADQVILEASAGPGVPLPAQLVPAVRRHVITGPMDEHPVLVDVAGLGPNEVVEAVEVVGVPAGIEHHIVPGMPSWFVELGSALGEGEDALDAGALIGLGDIEGGVIAPAAAGCDAEHLVAGTPDGITIFGQGPYPEPPAPCGYGALTDVGTAAIGGGHHPGGALDDGFAVRLSGAVSGTHELEIRALVVDSEAGTQRTLAEPVVVDQVLSTSGPFLDEDVAVPDEACPEARLEDIEFPDAPEGDAGLALRCLVQLGIAQGRADGAFHPADPVVRAQMASFLARLIDRLNEPLPAERPPPDDDDPPPFGDLVGSVHEPNAVLLWRLGISTGVQEPAGAPPTGGVYGAGLPTTRGQMASFLVRLAESVIDVPEASGAAVFADVDPGSTHGPNIERLRHLRVTQGFADGTFRPDEPVSRRAMVLFLARALEGFVEAEAATGV